MLETLKIDHTTFSFKLLYEDFLLLVMKISQFLMKIAQFLTKIAHKKKKHL